MTSGRTSDSTDVDDVRIIGFDRNEPAFAGPGKCILSEWYRAVFAGAGDTDAGVILLGRINPVGKLSVKIHAVELSRALVVNAGPAFPSIETDTGPSVIALDHSIRIFRIDPKIMIVSMGSGDFSETGSPIAGFPHLEVSEVHRIRMFWIRKDMAVIPGSVDQIPVFARSDPAFPIIVRTVKPGVFRFNDCPYPPALGWRKADSDFPESPFWKPSVVGDFFPTVSTIHASVDAASRTTALETPEIPMGFPKGCDQDSGIVGIHAEIDRTCFVTSEKDMFPVFATVFGTEDSPLFVGTKGMAECGDIYQIRILRMNTDLTDLTGFGKSKMIPTCSRIG